MSESYDWGGRREFLREAGYALRFNKAHEESSMHPRTNIMDAVCADGQRVVLKAISVSEHPHEAAISELLSSPPHVEHPRNHAIRLLDVLDDPEDDDVKLLVMPLCVPFYRPVFDTVGEVVDAVRQILEGIQYLHGIYIAHRDCNFTNIMQDPDAYPDGNFHPASPWMDSAHVHRSRPIPRAECWPKYRIIDFGLSRQYDPSHGPPLESIILGGDRSPPEHRHRLECNPFPTDIYFLGNLIRSLARPTWWPGGVSQAPPHRPLSFLLPMIDQMMDQDPSQRPTIDEVVIRFSCLCEQLTTADLCLPARPLPFIQSLKHRLRQAKRVWLGIPPFPGFKFFRPPTPMSDEMRCFFTQIPCITAPPPY
ncbi:kinase domain-containing protein [Favolaschia claudopus]|uniref:Kinase domain-containing protein n=1 Tax=Favolaschia claudopus TaxID=2862362 RepID=A0AAW0C830_9AGAR